MSAATATRGGYRLLVREPARSYALVLDGAEVGTLTLDGGPFAACRLSLDRSLTALPPRCAAPLMPFADIQNACAHLGAPLPDDTALSYAVARVSEERVVAAHALVRRVRADNHGLRRVLRGLADDLGAVQRDVENGEDEHAIEQIVELRSLAKCMGDDPDAPIVDLGPNVARLPLRSGPPSLEDGA